MKYYTVKAMHKNHSSSDYWLLITDLDHFGISKSAGEFVEIRQKYQHGLTYVIKPAHAWTAETYKLDKVYGCRLVPCPTDK